MPLYEALSGDGTRNIRLDAERLPPMLAAATIAAEDRRFYSHPGIDPIAIVRAAQAQRRGAQVVEGGSTISQQTAKLLLSRRSPQRSRGWAAKVHEAVLAQRLEHRFDKRQILALYLNLAAYGNQVVGAGRASHAYFGHDASMLTRRRRRSWPACRSVRPASTRTAIRAPALARQQVGAAAHAVRAGAITR